MTENKMCGSENKEGRNYITIKFRAVCVGGAIWRGLRREETKCAECDIEEVEDVKHKSHGTEKERS